MHLCEGLSHKAEHLEGQLFIVVHQSVHKKIFQREK